MRPLRGIRVLDLTRLLPGPFGSLVLADLGATVDKIEDTSGGDYLRHMPPQVAGENAAFQALNRGKRSAVLNLKAPEGKAAFERLIGSYDVLFEQFRPGVMARLGLSPESLTEQHPRLIVCSLTGYGQHGELQSRAGHDLNYLARAGLLGFQGPEGGPPQVSAAQLADVSGGMWCVIAVLAALTERERTGRGTVLDIAMTDGVLGFASTSIAAALAGVAPPAGTDFLSGGLAPYATYLTSDGHAMTLAALEPKFWLAFCAAADLEPDPTALMPGPHQTALKQRLTELFAERTREAWIQFASEHDCAIEPVVEPTELRTDPHLASRDLFFDLDTPRGPVPQFRTPVTPKDRDFTVPPTSGQHTRDVLSEGGLSASEIEALLEAGVARQG